MTLSPIRLAEKLLFLLVLGYDRFFYNPLQLCLSPVVAKIPRCVTVGGRVTEVFTANGVTYARTLLVVPIAMFLKNECYLAAGLSVALHDFLDHLDGIVAKAQRRVYGNIDDPALGAFLDAFCDKIVNVCCLWTILLLTNVSSLNYVQAFFYLTVCSAVIIYELILGVVRIQDYYKSKYNTSVGNVDGSKVLHANMEGKTKEKLESVGLALLCLALAYDNPMASKVGIGGILCLALSLWFAHGSLMYKLRARRTQLKSAQTLNGGPIEPATNDVFELQAFSSDVSKTQHSIDEFVYRQVRRVNSTPVFQIHSSDSESTSSDKDEDTDNKVDKIYTIGCFDLFHRGHHILLKRMRTLGKKVIVGVHNDESYLQLKKKHPIDNTEKRMENVKKYADQVFVVSSTDPSPYIQCCVHLEPGEQALYVRGDDMPSFPGRAVVEPLMPIKLLPYTQGISSTMLRQALAKQKEL